MEVANRSNKTILKVLQNLDFVQFRGTVEAVNCLMYACCESYKWSTSSSSRIHPVFMASSRERFWELKSTLPLQSGERSLKQERRVLQDWKSFSVSFVQPYNEHERKSLTEAN